MEKLFKGSNFIEKFGPSYKKRRRCKIFRQFLTFSNPHDPKSESITVQSFDADMVDMLDAQDSFNTGLEQDPAKYYQMISGFFGV